MRLSLNVKNCFSFSGACPPDTSTRGLWTPLGAVTSTFTDQLSDLLDQQVLLDSPFVIAGDFNVPSDVDGLDIRTASYCRRVHAVQPPSARQLRYSLRWQCPRLGPLARQWDTARAARLRGSSTVRLLLRSSAGHLPRGTAAAVTTSDDDLPLPVTSTNGQGSLLSGHSATRLVLFASVRPRRVRWRLTCWTLRWRGFWTSTRHWELDVVAAAVSTTRMFCLTKLNGPSSFDAVWNVDVAAPVFRQTNKLTMRPAKQHATANWPALPAPLKLRHYGVIKMYYYYYYY